MPDDKIKLASPNTGFALAEHLAFSHEREMMGNVRELKAEHTKMHSQEYWNHYHGKAN